MTICDRILENRCVMGGNQGQSREKILNQTLEYYIRLILALALDLMLRPEYDARFSTADMKRQRRAWEIAVRYFLVLPDDRRRSQLSRVRERYYEELAELGIVLPEEEKARIRELVGGFLQNRATCFLPMRPMGSYLALAQALIEFNMTNLNAEVWPQLNKELEALKELHRAVKSIVDDRNNAVHEFFGHLSRNDFDFEENYFLKNSELVVIQNDTMIDGEYLPCLMLSEPRVALELPMRDLLRLRQGENADNPYFREAALNGFGLKPWRTAMLRVQPAGELTPRYYLLSPLVGVRLRNGDADPFIFQSIPNKTLGEFRYLSLRANVNTINWREADGDVYMEEAENVEITAFPVVDWGALWARLTDATFNSETTEIARPDGIGTYRINILAEEQGRTYPDFVSCLRVPGIPPAFSISVHAPESLKKLRMMFYSEGCETPFLHVTGKGGVGKTHTVLNTLRTEYVANAVREKAVQLLPFDYVLFLTAKTIQYSVEGTKHIEPYPRSSFSNTRSAFHRLLCCLKGQTLADCADEEILERQIINAIGEKKVMLILDDLDSVVGVRNDENEPQYLADQREQTYLVNRLENIHAVVTRNGGVLRVIITTRHCLNSYHDLALKPLSDPEAVAFAECYWNKGRSVCEELPEDCQRYVKEYGEGTPGIIMRILHVYRANRDKEFWQNEQNQQALRQEIARFSLATTRLRREGQYIMQMLLDYKNLTLPISLIHLSLFDKEIADNESGIKNLRDWNLIVDVPQSNGSIALQGETLLLYNEIENNDGLPAVNKKVLDELLLEYRKRGRRYNAQDIADILPGVCEKMLNTLRGAQKHAFAQRLHLLINEIPLAHQLTVQDRQRLNELAASVLETTRAETVPAPAAGRDPKLVRLDEMIAALEAAVDENWRWDAAALIEMAEYLRDLGEAVELSVCRSAINAVKNHLEQMFEQVRDEDLPFEQVRLILGRMRECCQVEGRQNLWRRLQRFLDILE